MNQTPKTYWSVSVTEMLQKLETVKGGLTEEEAGQRLITYGANLLRPQKQYTILTPLLSQFKSLIILILLFATGLSFFLSNPIDILIILTIVIISGLLGFWQERSASNAMQKIISIVQIKAAVMRGGSSKEIPLAENFWFNSLPILFFPLIEGVVLLYILIVEIVKRVFYKMVKF